MKKNQFIAINEADITIVHRLSFETNTASRKSVTFLLKNKIAKKNKNDQSVL